MIHSRCENSRAILVHCGVAHGAFGLTKPHRSRLAQGQNSRQRRARTIKGDSLASTGYRLRISDASDILVPTKSSGNQNVRYPKNVVTGR